MFAVLQVISIYEKGGWGQFCPCMNMKDSRRSVPFLISMTLLVLMLIFGTAFAESVDPIRVSSLSEPQSVISEQDVSITIKIYNSSQQDMQEAITLYDSVGLAVEKYQGLGAEQSVTYTGTWHVTADQIAKGKINYFIRYNLDGKEKTKTIPITIQTETAAPQLIANYAISPASARQGQQMSIAYTLSNTGNIELRNITIINPGISETILTAASLSVGERIVLEDFFPMGAGEMVCEPKITYTSADSSEIKTVEDINRRVLSPAEDGLEVELVASGTENLYPGENVELTARLKNTGDSSYVGLQIQLSDGSVVATGVELAAGATYETDFDWIPTQTTELVATVSGLDAEGDTITIHSAPLTITTQDAAMALILKIEAAAETDVIYSEPAVVRFAVQVTNLGETDATTLTITEAGTTVATIPSLPSGERRQLVFELETSIAGQIQFEVTGKDAAGNDKTYASNILALTYIEPTPAPTSTPVPTAVPPTPSPAPTATPEPSALEQIAGMFDPLVLRIVAAALVCLIAAVLAVHAARKSSKKRQIANAIDVLERAHDERDYRGRHRKKKTQEKEPKGKKNEAVATSELTEEDVRKAPAKEQPATPETKESPRRASRSVPVTSEPTLRVEPAERRPEFPQTRQPDNSKTKVFNRPEGESQDFGSTKRVPIAKTKDLIKAQENAQENVQETKRLKRDNGKNTQPEEKASEPVKEKKRGLFGKRKKDSDYFEEEDLFE